MFFLCEDIQAPFKLSKVEDPTISIIFLGIHLNSTMMEASISDDRKQALLDKLRWMKQRDKVTKRDLLFLIGSYHSVAKYFQLSRYS